MNNNILKKCDTALDAVGRTSMIKLSRIAEKHGIKCQVYAKFEAENPCQSIKNRMASYIISKAEREGKLMKGGTVVECSSGNTGVALSMVCAVKGLKMKVFTTDNASKEKIDTIRSFGAEVVVCDSALHPTHKDSYMGKAREAAELPNHYWVNQCYNEDNANSHYNGTGIEICDQLDNKIDFLFLTAGSFGTISGCARRLKETIEDVKVIGIDPIGSMLSKPDSLNTSKKKYKVEGIGHSIQPGIARYDLVDEWVKVDDKETFLMTRDIISTEGLLVGGSSGHVLEGMFRYLKANKLDKMENLVCVTIFPDSAKDYMNKFMCDSWMIGNGFFDYNDFVKKDHYFGLKTLSDYPQIKAVPYYDKRLSIEICLELFDKGLTVIPIRDKNKIIGVVDKKTLLKTFLKKNLKKTKSVVNCLNSNFLLVGYETPLSVVQFMLEDQNSVLIGKDIEDNKVSELYVITNNTFVGLLTEDLREILC